MFCRQSMIVSANRALFLLQGLIFAKFDQYFWNKIWFFPKIRLCFYCKADFCEIWSIFLEQNVIFPKNQTLFQLQGWFLRNLINIFRTKRDFSRKSDFVSQTASKRRTFRLCRPNNAYFFIKIIQCFSDFVLTTRSRERDEIQLYGRRSIRVRPIRAIE